MKTTLLLTAAAAILVVPAISAAQTHRAPAKKPATTAAPAPPAKPAPPPKPHVVPDAGVLDAADIVAIDQMAENVTKDQFSEDRTGKYEGRDFSFAIPASSVSTGYDRDTHKLSVRPPFDVTFLNKTTSEDVPGVNGYGAHFTFTKVRGQKYGATITDQGLKLSDTYSWEMDGEAARAISKSLSYRVTGKVTTKASEYPPNKPTVVYVNSTLTDATANRPFDIFVQHYGVNVAISHIDLIDDRTGTVVKSWDQQVAVAPRTPESEKRIAAKIAGTIPTSIHWTKEPSTTELSNFGPIDTILKHRAVSQTVNCRIAERYGLKDCKIVGEPNGFFSLAFYWHAAARDADGDDVVGMPVTLHVTFPAR